MNKDTKKRKSNSGGSKKKTTKVTEEHEEEEEEEEEEYDSADENESDDCEEGRGGYKKGGYHPVKIGEIYKNKYIVVKKLGWGHFSTVWLAKDKTNNNYVAIKIVKSAQHYTDAAKDEIKLLDCVSKHDPDGRKYVVKLLDNFTHTGPHGKHIVMVFEVLGKTILDLIEKNYNGINLKVVKSITKQILIALDFLHSQCNIIHTDLKPENILLVEPFYVDEDGTLVPDSPVTNIKIADLGNGCWINEHFTTDIQTRQYRSPEVIIKAPYSTSADMWSLGCIVFELATGDLLFKPKKGTHHGKSDDHLALILELLDRKTYPQYLLESAQKAKDYFNSNFTLRKIKNLKLWPLKDVLISKYKFSETDAVELANFILPMLHIDPDRRLTAASALQHAWLRDADTTICLTDNHNILEDSMDIEEEEED